MQSLVTAKKEKEMLTERNVRPQKSQTLDGPFGRLSLLNNVSVIIVADIQARISNSSDEIHKLLWQARRRVPQRVQLHHSHNKFESWLRRLWCGSLQ